MQYAYFALGGLAGLVLTIAAIFACHVAEFRRKEARYGQSCTRRQAARYLIRGSF